MNILDRHIDVNEWQHKHRGGPQGNFLAEIINSTAQLEDLSEAQFWPFPFFCEALQKCTAFRVLIGIEFIPAEDFKHLQSSQCQSEKSVLSNKIAQNKNVEILIEMTFFFVI